MNNDTPADAMGLKPCPFCGAQPLSLWNDASDGQGSDDCGFWSIECCHAHVHMDDEPEAIAAWNTRAPSLAAQDGLVDALRYARSQIVGLAVSGTDRIDELCRKLQQMDPSPIWPIPFPDPPERTWQPIVKRIDEALASIEVKS